MILSFTAEARRDLVRILSASGVRFGSEAQHRYRLLLERAVTDLLLDPERVGVNRPPEVKGDTRLYHSRRALPRMPEALRVGRPRHVLVFRVRGDTVVILRILHDAMDIPRRLRGRS